MRCIVCSSEMEKGKSRCAVCGFPILQMVSGDSKEQKKRKQIADAYFQKKTSGITISCMAYTYEQQDGGLDLKSEDEIVLAKGDCLQMGKIVWHLEKFARTEGEISMQILIRSETGKMKKYDLSWESPKQKDFWEVGVLMEPGLTIRIVTRAADELTCSEACSFLF